MLYTEQLDFAAFLYGHYQTLLSVFICLLVTFMASTVICYCPWNGCFESSDQNQVHTKDRALQALPLSMPLSAQHSTDLHSSYRSPKLYFHCTITCQPRGKCSMPVPLCSNPGVSQSLLSQPVLPVSLHPSVANFPVSAQHFQSSPTATHRISSHSSLY